MIYCSVFWYCATFDDDIIDGSARFLDERGGHAANEAIVTDEWLQYCRSSATMISIDIIIYEAFKMACNKYNEALPAASKRKFHQSNVEPLFSIII